MVKAADITSGIARAIQLIRENEKLTEEEKEQIIQHLESAMRETDRYRKLRYMNRSY